MARWGPTSAVVTSSSTGASLLFVDQGYATFSALLEHATAAAIDAVYVTHGHPDHCVDLNPLLRARVLIEEGLPPLPVYAPRGALDAVLALDRPGMLADGYTLHELEGEERLGLGPFAAETRLLPHMLPNLGLRLEADGSVLAYTGDTGPSPEVGRLARGRRPAPGRGDVDRRGARRQPGAPLQRGGGRRPRGGCGSAPTAARPPPAGHRSGGRAGRRAEPL